MSDGTRLSLLQQERSRETHRKLVRAGQKLWRQKGLVDTTVGEICDAAGVAKGTFYFYFSRKEDLLVEIGLSSSEHVWEAVEPLMDSDQSTARLLRATVEQMASNAERTPKHLLFELMVELYRHVADWSALRAGRVDVRTILEAILERGQDRGEVRQDLTAEELATTMTSVVLQAITQWARDDDGTELEAIVWRRARLVYEGATST